MGGLGGLVLGREGQQAVQLQLAVAVRRRHHGLHAGQAVVLQIQGGGAVRLRGDRDDGAARPGRDREPGALCPAGVQVVQLDEGARAAPREQFEVPPGQGRDEGQVADRLAVPGQLAARYASAMPPSARK